MSYLPFKKNSCANLLKSPCTVRNEQCNECCSVLSLRHLPDPGKFTMKKKREGDGGKQCEM